MKPVTLEELEFVQIGILRSISQLMNTYSGESLAAELEKMMGHGTLLDMMVYNTTTALRMRWAADGMPDDVREANMEALLPLRTVLNVLALLDFDFRTIVPAQITEATFEALKAFLESIDTFTESARTGVIIHAPIVEPIDPIKADDPKDTSQDADNAQVPIETA